MSVSATMRLSIYHASEVVDTSGSVVSSFPDPKPTFLPAPGTGSRQVDTAFRDAQTLISAAHTYTWSALPGGLVMARLRQLFVQVTSAAGSGGSLLIAPGATHGWPGVTWTGVPGSILLLTWPDVPGAPAVSGVSDQVTFTATGTVTYIMAALGCSV